MHDNQVEERLRSILRSEGDHLPMTISASELERRLLLRRRRVQGRRISLVAAAVAVVAIGAIGALGNGWLQQPSSGTTTSPSPSAGARPTPIGGLSRLVRSANGRLVVEIEPTASGSGASQVIRRAVGATDYVVSVKVLCTGEGSVIFTRGTPTTETACTPGVGIDPAFQPDPTLVPTIDGSFDTTLTVTPGITYTMLVETVPLPDHIPTLVVPDGAIGMKSSILIPTPNGLAGAGSNISTDHLAGSGPEWIEVVCLGPGVVSYTLEPGDGSSGGSTADVVCDGRTVEDEIAIDFTGDPVLTVGFDNRTAWQLVATRQGPLSTNHPTSTRSPLGSPGEAVLVRPVGDADRPTSFEVTRLDPASGIVVHVATVPGTILPSDYDPGSAMAPTVSSTGWLAMHIHHGPAADQMIPAFVIVDLLDPTAEPWVIDGYQSGTWNGADELALVVNNGVAVARPATRELLPISFVSPAVDILLGIHTLAPVWSAAPGSRFLARQDIGATNPWGAVDAAGIFTPTTDLPAAYQRSGLERVAGVGAHVLTQGCDSGGTSASGCVLVEMDATGTLVGTRVDGRDIATLDDYAWTADGRNAWLLMDAGTGDSGHAVSLSLSTPSGSRVERGKISIPDLPQAAILGIGSQPTSGGQGFVAVGDEAGFIRAFVAFDGSQVAMQDYEVAWFAGWAGEQTAYDPD